MRRDRVEVLRGALAVELREVVRCREARPQAAERAPEHAAEDDLGARILASDRRMRDGRAASRTRSRSAAARRRWASSARSRSATHGPATAGRWGSRPRSRRRARSGRPPRRRTRTTPRVPSLPPGRRPRSRPLHTRGRRGGPPTRGFRTGTAAGAMWFSAARRTYESGPDQSNVPLDGSTPAQCRPKRSVPTFALAIRLKSRSVSALCGATPKNHLGARAWATATASSSEATASAPTMTAASALGITGEPPRRTLSMRASRSRRGLANRRARTICRPRCLPACRATSTRTPLAA